MFAFDMLNKPLLVPSKSKHLISLLISSKIALTIKATLGADLSNLTVKRSSYVVARGNITKSNSTFRY